MRATLAAVGAAIVLTGSPAAATAMPSNDVGPATGITPSGRQLAPAGRLTAVGDFPTGGALTPDGRFFWAVDAGHGHNDVTIVDVSTGAVTQVLPLPGAYVGVAFAPDGRSAYVSGEPSGNSQPPADGPTTAGGGDAIHVFSVDPAGGRAVEGNPIPLPATSGGMAQKHASMPVGLGPPTPGPGASSGLGWPQGLAVTRDGRRLVVALNQADRVAIIDLPTRTSRLVRVGSYPYAVAIARDGKAWVSSEGDGTVQAIDLDAGAVVATVGVGGALGNAYAHAEGLAADPARDRLYVAVTSRDLVAVVDTASQRLAGSVSVGRAAGLGTSPSALALAPGGSSLYVADSGEDALAVISVADPGGLSPTPGGAASSGRSAHPHRVVRARSLRSIARYVSLQRRARRRGHRALERLRSKLLYGPVVLACGGPSTRAERRYARAVLHALRGPRSRRRRAAARARRHLVRLRSCRGSAGSSSGAPGSPGPPGAERAPTLVGRIPTAAYPTAAAVTPDGRTLVWLAGKGLGAGPNPEYGQHFAASEKAPYGSYVVDKLLGRVGVLAVPTAAMLPALSATADREVTPADAQAPPHATPLRVGGPIKHVFIVVRENRTYDQVFGSNPRGNGDPALELFDDNGAPGPAGGVTPNAHALSAMFPLLDHFYANSEVSVDGHLITSGAYAIDYVQKALHANYGGRGRVDEFGQYPITFPPRDFLFDQAVRQGVSFQNDGELSAGVLPSADDGRPTYRAVQAGTAFGYPFLFGCTGSPTACDTDSGTPGPAGASGAATSRFDFFQNQFQAQVLSGTVPALTYLTLPNDHTNGVSPGYPTPKALVADNDLALGQIVDMISHSSIWGQSAIFVEEDDSQDGADHIDAHRMPAFVISPWARHGAVVSTRYDQESVLRSVETILGLQPLSLLDSLATPMYDAFTGRPDLTPYAVRTPTQSRSERTGSPAHGVARVLPYSHVDLVPQELFDRALWHSVYGWRSSPPGPGPDASPAEHARALGALSVYRHGGDVQRWLQGHSAAEH